MRGMSIGRVGESIQLNKVAIWNLMPELILPQIIEARVDTREDFNKIPSDPFTTTDTSEGPKISKEFIYHKRELVMANIYIYI